MKTLILTIIVTMSFLANASEKCSETQSESAQDVIYQVNKDMPSHLKGATITITQADGKTSTVPAEKFMVVPRKQYTKVGQNKTLTNKISCSVNKDIKKNILMGEVRKDVTGIETSTNGKTASVHSNKELIPGVNYYRRQVLDTPVGAGLGVDTNGTLKGMVGIDF